ncbi:MAG TPA: HDIG domain-containing protein [Candidatus Aminicenantes bacterium]|nr:HDIG domain-containing protein [Candidatus Aminicenantes bacterium]
MNRTEALKLVNQHLENPNMVKHCLAVEACMRALATRFDGDPHTWGLAGLLHDLDYAFTADDPDRHGIQTTEMLADYDLSADILHAIKAHNGKAGLDSLMDIALYTTDPTTGFIIACALMHPDRKLAAIDLRFMQKRFNAKAFARGAGREQMAECRRLNMNLDEFLNTCLDAMTGIAAELGL